VCQDAISSTEFLEWIAYDRINPIVDGNTLRVYFGNVVATLLNTQRKKRSDRVWTWEDIYPPDRGPKRKKTPEELLAQVEMINALFGGKDERQKPPIA